MLNTVRVLLILGGAAAASCAAAAQDPPARKLTPAESKAMDFDEADLNERVTPEVKAVRRAENSVVSIYVLTRDEREARFRGTPVEGQGSGVIIDASGLVITNWHVAAYPAARPDAFQTQVRLKDGRKFGARILNVSRDHDLALLQMELPDGEHVKPISIGDSDSLMVGETLIAIGNPQGHANTVTRGVLSAVDREIAARTPDGGVLQLKGLLQTDAAINQGNSGGALLDITGKLVGVNNAMAANAENIGFAIPVNTVQRVFHELLVGSANFSMWMGMRLDERDGALEVAAIDPGGPAERAGLQVGDKVVAADRQPVRSSLDYARVLVSAQAGRAFPLAVRRGNRELEVTPVPLSPSMGRIARAIGLQVEEVRDRSVLQAAGSVLGVRPGYRLPLVLRVSNVVKDSSADNSGVQVGDVLLYWVDRSPWGNSKRLFEGIDGLAQLLAAAQGQDLYVSVLREGEVYDGPIRVN
ncbi:MAG: trypsin-like peptidase domain-containing protein [Planctomycetota bacterium]